MRLGKRERLALREKEAIRRAIRARNARVSGPRLPTVWTRQMDYCISPRQVIQKRLGFVDADGRIRYND